MTEYGNKTRKEFYLQRAEEMRRLRNVEFLSLREIGKIYGVTRERVRQIVGDNQLPHNITPITRFFLQNPDTSQYTNMELALKLNCAYETITRARKGIRHAYTSPNIAVANYWQEWFANKLDERGIANQLMPIHYHYNIETSNGAKITVCTAINEQISPSIMRNCVSPRWRFSVRKTILRRKPDFYALIIASLGAVFILPYSVVPNVTQMAFCYPPLARPTMFKWGQYKDAYHLIKKFRSKR